MPPVTVVRRGKGSVDQQEPEEAPLPEEPKKESGCCIIS